MNKISLLKGIDKTIGSLFLSLVRENKKSNCSNYSRIRKVLFIRPGGIGDATLLLPSIILLKKAYPDLSIDILAERRNSAIFSLCSEVDTIYHYDRVKEFIRLFSRSYDVVIDTEQWHRLSAVVVRLMMSPMSIGYATNERDKLFTHAVMYARDDHEIESFRHLVLPLLENNLIVCKPPFLQLPAGVVERVKPLLERLAGRKFVAVFPGGSIRQKRWGNDKFRDIARLLIERGYGVVVVGGEEDVSYGEGISNGCSFIFDVCGQLSLVETAAVVKESHLLISGDSGIMHIASSLGTRVLALFGPSNVKKWAPRSEYSCVISKYLPCSPCSKFGYTPRCNNDMACMKQITVSEVFENATKLLEK